MTTNQILKALREGGLTAKGAWPKADTPANEWPNALLLGGRVLNVCTHSVLGGGCINNPAYESTRDGLCQKVEAALTSAGVSFRKSLPDQYVLSR